MFLYLFAEVCYNFNILCRIHGATIFTSRIDYFKEVLTLNKLKEYISQILNGDLPITDKLKYSMVIYPIAAVHGLLMVFFLFQGITPMTIYSLLSMILYLYCRRFIQEENYPLIYYIACGEVILHTFLTTYLIDWEAGFALFCIALVPSGFYISYTFPKHRLKTPLVCGGISILSYLACYYIGQVHTAYYSIANQTVLQALYIFNTLCTFAFLALFSIFFMIEVRLSQRKLFEENKMLGQIAGIDALTGLYNRWSMAKFLSDAFQTEQPFCLIMCDIDDFKHINDTYGHECGDEVLKHISRIIRDFIPNGSYVCRWGGEELLILLNCYSLGDSATLAEKIRCSIANTSTQFQESTISHTITMGVAHHHKNQTLESTIAKADMKLYIGKRQGKNTVIF